MTKTFLRLSTLLDLLCYAKGFHILSMRALEATIEDLIEQKFKYKDLKFKYEGVNPNLKLWISWRWLSGI